MNAKQFEDLLHELGACSSAVEWAHGKTLHIVWKSCDRGDWLLWLAGKMAGKKGWPTKKQVVLAACACAEQALKYLPKGEDRPKKAIQTARAWAKGKATLEEVRNAASASSASSASSAAYAAYAASSAASSAAYAAYAASSAASYAAYAAVNAKELADTANIVRKLIEEPKPVLRRNR